MKKIISITLALCLTVSVALLSGCDNKKTSSGGNTSSGGSASTAERSIRNLNGRTVTIATTDNYGDRKTGESETDDKRLEYFKKIENELNCKIEWVSYGNEELTTKLITTALSGDKFCDIAIPIFWNTAANFTNKVLVDLNTVDTLNMKADYWHQPTNELLSVNGVLRASACGLTCLPVNETAAVVFNKRIIKEMNLENPYELYKNGKWTVEKLREMAKKATKDLDGVSGMTKNDQWGITTLDRTALTQDIYTAYGFRTITKNGTGVYQYNMNNSDFITHLKWIQDWYCNDASIFVNDDQDAQHAQFSNGKALFYIFQLNYLSKFKNMTDDYGVVPFPMGSDKDNYAGLMNWNTRLMGIPVTVKGEELLDAGSVMQALAYYSKDDNNNKKQEIVGRYLRDSESIEMLDKISETGIHVPELFIATARFQSIQQNTTWIAFAGVSDPTYDFAQKIAETKNTANSLIAEFSASIAKK